MLREILQGLLALKPWLAGASILVALLMLAGLAVDVAGALWARLRKQQVARASVLSGQEALLVAAAAALLYALK